MIINIDSEIAKKLTNTELAIVKFINSNETRLSELSIVDIAFDTYSSPATVSRAIRKCGIQGFNELRYLSTKKSENKEVINAGDIMHNSLVECQRVIEQISITKILDVISLLKESDKIYVFARGMTEYVAKEFSFKLQLMDFNVVFINDPNIMTKISMKIKEGECIFIFSLKGKTEELVESARAAHLMGGKIITCCCSENTELMELSTYFLLGYKHEYVAIREYEVLSRIALNVISRIIIDYIAIY